MRTQSKTTQALEGIMADLSRMKFEDGVQPPSASQAGGLVYIDGDVVRTGVYQLPLSGGLTVRRAITAAGGSKGDAVGVIVHATDSQGNNVVRFKADRLDLRDKSAADYTLAPNDHVTVTAIDNTDAMAASGDSDSRVLVEGDGKDVGWHAIDMNKGTLLSDMLKSLGVAENQWVSYKHAGGAATIKLARDYLSDAAERRVLRPNDELLVRNDVPVATRRHYVQQNMFRTSEEPTAWASEPVEGQPRWFILIPQSRGGVPRLVREHGSQIWNLAFQPEGLGVIVANWPTRTCRSSPTGTWTSTPAGWCWISRTCATIRDRPPTIPGRPRRCPRSPAGWSSLRPATINCSASTPVQRSGPRRSATSCWRCSTWPT
jgi:hypothetical protein